jgi:hypothetical protein
MWRDFQANLPPLGVEELWDAFVNGWRQPAALLTVCHFADTADHPAGARIRAFSNLRALRPGRQLAVLPARASADRDLWRIHSDPLSDLLPARPVRRGGGRPLADSCSCFRRWLSGWRTRK